MSFCSTLKARQCRDHIGTNVATFLVVRGTEFEDEEEAAHWKKQALIPVLGPVKWFFGGDSE